MHLFPQDLGEKRCRTLVARRAGQPLPPTEAPSPPVGFWGRRWLGKQKGQMNPEEVQTTLRAIRTHARAWSVLGLLPTPGALTFLLDALNHYYSHPRYMTTSPAHTHSTTCSPRCSLTVSLVLGPGSLPLSSRAGSWCVGTGRCTNAP